MTSEEMTWMLYPQPEKTMITTRAIMVGMHPVDPVGVGVEVATLVVVVGMISEEMILINPEEVAEVGLIGVVAGQVDVAQNQEKITVPTEVQGDPEEAGEQVVSSPGVDLETTTRWLMLQTLWIWVIKRKKSGTEV